MSKPVGVKHEVKHTFTFASLVIKRILLQAVVAHPRNVDMQCNFVLAAGDVYLPMPPVECNGDEQAGRRAKLEDLEETNLLVSSALFVRLWCRSCSWRRLK